MLANLIMLSANPDKKRANICLAKYSVINQMKGKIEGFSSVLEESSSRIMEIIGGHEIK